MKTAAASVVAILALVPVLSGCGDSSSASAGEAKPEYLNADGASTSPYSDAVRVGSTLYLAGNLGLDTNGKLVPGGIKAETARTMENLKAALEKNGSSLERIANCEVMLADIKERDAFNEIYSTYWQPLHFPARHAFGVTGLYLGARVEIACIAVTT
ncbi:MAG TPA: RidA family protein [Sporichthya sp.]|nr:RidA family protein [Sporichthya sp.]